MISACDKCTRMAELSARWLCPECEADPCDTEPAPPPDFDVSPPAMHAAVLRYDGEDWEGAGRAEYELAMQEMGDADYE